MDCNTQYPIVLAHGVLARNVTFGIPFWWKLIEPLKSHGAPIYEADQPAFAKLEYNAAYLKTFIQQVLAETGKEKVNIIGHATGALEARYMISNLGMGKHVASLTSIAAPNKGSSLVDFCFRMLPGLLLKIIGATLNAYGRIMGDKKPDSLGIFRQLTTDYMVNEFNPKNPDHPDVYYQSWIGEINYITFEKAIFWAVPWMIMKHYEGPNDGWVSRESAKWGNFLGVQAGAPGSSGVSHDNSINHFFGKTSGYDPIPYYIEVVSGLKERGF